MRKEDVIRYFGSVTSTAKRLNMAQSSVSEWDRIIPKWRAMQVHTITKGKLRFDPELYR